MHICLMNYTMGVGGAERVLFEVARGLDERGHRVALVSAGGEFADRLRRQTGVDLHIVPSLRRRSALALARSARRLRGIFLELEPDIINAHAFVPGVLMAASAAAGGVRARRLLTVHFPERALYYPVIGRTAGHLFHDMNTVCQETRACLRERGLPRHLGEVVYNGIDPNWLQDRNDIEQRPLPGHDGTVRIGVLARLIPRKGHLTLLEAVHRLTQAGEGGFQVAIAGDGPFRRTLERRVAELGLEPRVQFQGIRTDAMTFLDEANLFVLPSHLEAFPMSILEAFARGLPVLCSAVNGVPEVVKEGETGFLFPAGDVDALVMALRRVAAQPAKVAEVRRRARDVVERSFTTARMVERYEAWYSRVLG